MTTTSRALLTVEQAAERLAIGRTTAYALVKSGELASTKLGRLRRVPDAAIADYINRLTAESDH
jgi:excisionase family DNA binding protein